MNSVTISLAPFQSLIYLFPTILFFVSLIARVILMFTANKKLVSTLRQYTNVLLEEINKETVNPKEINAKKIINDFLVTRKNELGKIEPPDPEDKKWNNSHFLFSFFIDSFILSIANGVIIMFQSLDIFYGFILLFIGITLSVFGFALIFTSRLKWATFLVFMMIFLIFIPEMLFFITSSFYWFWLIFIIIFVILVVVIAIAIISEKLKERNDTKNPDNS